MRGEAHRFLTIPGIGSEVWALTAIAPWARPSYTITNSVSAYPGSTACLMADFYRRVPGFCGPDLPFPQAQ